MGAVGADGSAGNVVASLSRPGAGAFRAASFSASLLAAAGRGFVSLTRWECRGTGCAGWGGASGCFAAETSSCAPFMSAGGGGAVLAVVPGCRTPQPARESERAMRTAPGTAVRGEPETGRGLAAGEQFRHPNWVSQGARSLARTEMLFPNAGTAPAWFRAFKSFVALMSIIVACVSFRPARGASHRPACSPQNPEQHGSGQTQLCKPPDQSLPPARPFEAWRAGRRALLSRACGRGAQWGRSLSSSSD